MSEQSRRFQQQVETLVDAFEKGVDTQEWVTKRYEKRMRDDDGQVYAVPSLTLWKGPTRLLLDPVGYDVPGAEAAADLFLMPAYDPTASLYLEDGNWMLHYVFPPGTDEATRLTLSPETINLVLDSIAQYAVPSV